MCTTIQKKLDKPVFAWKVVKVFSNGQVCSFVMDNYKWSPNSNHYPSFNGTFIPNPDMLGCFKRDYEVFHCMTTRKIARKLLRYVNRHPSAMQKNVIIKVKLSGEVFDGIFSYGQLINVPSYCGTEAFWDGKFHR